jgi:hypothetical protein
MHTKRNIPDIPAGGVAIVWAKPGQLSRTVISRSNQKVTFKVPSFKTGKMLYAESSIECSFYRRIDTDPEVEKVVPQPAILYYLDAGITRRHFPDCLVVRSTPARTFVEIKSASDPKLAEAYRRAELLIPGLLKQGYGYEVITSAEIRAKPYFDNARTLLRLGRKPVGAMEAESIRQSILQRPQTTWRDILHGALGAKAPFHVARLILDGVLIFDSSKLLGASTVIAPLPSTL